MEAPGRHPPGDTRAERARPIGSARHLLWDRAVRTCASLLVLFAVGCVGDLSLDLPGTGGGGGDGNGPPNIYLDAGPGGGGLPPVPGGDAGAGLPPDGFDAGPGLMDECGDLRTVATVHHGTPEPTYLPLTQGQIYAVASFNGCSGLITGDGSWVLSATHCGQRAGQQVCVDRRAQSPTICFRIAQVYNEPSGSDLTLLRLEENVTDTFGELEPVQILYEDIDSSWVGRTAEAGGFGQQEAGGFNEREFTANDITEIRGDRIVVNGYGESGVCYGDSGGPIMVLADDGSVRSAGVVSDGDGTCTYVATFTRLDPYRDFLERHMGPTPGPGAPPCGDVTVEGECVDGNAVYCGAGDELQMERCDVCGWNDGVGGFRCLPGPDPCEGLSPRGRCEAGVARWCDRGEVKERDCGACMQTCVIDGAVGAICQ